MRRLLSMCTSAMCFAPSRCSVDCNFVAANRISRLNVTSCGILYRTVRAALRGRCCVHTPTLHAGTFCFMNVLNPAVPGQKQCDSTNIPVQCISNKNVSEW